MSGRMKTLLARQIAAQIQLELQIWHLVQQWAQGERKLRALLKVAEQLAGLDLATQGQQSAWQTFRRAHSLDQIAGVLLVLELRGLSLGDFVDAWLVAGDLHAAVHRLWRQPSAHGDIELIHHSSS